MEQYQVELADAVTRMTAMGKNPDDYTFDMTYMPPDPDGAGMFTLMYEIIVTHKPSDTSLKLIGGIGWRWVDHLESALKEGVLE